MLDINSTSCCGLKELDGLSKDPERTLINFWENISEPRSVWDEDEKKGAFYIFTDTVKDKNGDTLASYIKNNALGELVVTPARKNPNTGNMIKVWIWHPNTTNLARWFKKNKGNDDDSY